MEIINLLKGHEFVEKFQQVCGVVRLPDQEDSDENEGGSGKNSDELSQPYDSKYVKHRHSHKYVLRDTCKNNNNPLRPSENLQKEAVPPFTSDDSDSDNGLSRGQGRYKITPHRIDNKFLYYAFRIASFFGDEAFYLTFFPFVAWNLDAYVCRHTVYVWCMAMFLGQVTKDIFQWPRPLSPPVIRLETDFAQEFAMPSTHAVAGSSIPLVIGFTLLNRYQIPAPVVISLAIFWCFMVCCSRLYLGVHSILDLFGGILCSCLMAGLILPFINEIDWFIQTSPLAPVVLLVMCVGFSTVFYPAPEIGNNTRGDCIQVLSATTGCLLGNWFNYFNGMSVAIEPEGLYPISAPSLKFFMTAILRFMIGVITLALVKTVVTVVSVKGVSYVFGLTKPDRHHPRVVIYYKLITYTALGIIIMFTVPILHTKFGLGRAGFYTEIL